MEKSPCRAPSGNGENKKDATFHDAPKTKPPADVLLSVD